MSPKNEGMIEMNTVTLYKWHNFDATQTRRYGFSLSGRMSFEFVGEVAEGEYVLPAGFEVAESNAGTTEIYDENGRACTLEASGDLPLLRVHGKSIILSPVK
jgi:hypothetical protein